MKIFWICFVIDIESNCCYFETTQFDKHFSGILNIDNVQNRQGRSNTEPIAARSATDKQQALFESFGSLSLSFFTLKLSRVQQTI